MATFVASTRVLGRRIWADDRKGSDPVAELLCAMVRQANKDIARAVQLGDRATPAQVAARVSAEQFLEECKSELSA